jgi:hypothetical protein
MDSLTELENKMFAGRDGQKRVFQDAQVAILIFFF